jgi:hypothetical protein
MLLPRRLAAAATALETSAVLSVSSGMALRSRAVIDGVAATYGDDTHDRFGLLEEGRFLLTQDSLQKHPQQHSPLRSATAAAALHHQASLDIWWFTETAL